MKTKELAEMMLENRAPSLLMTDGYKFAMAQAGFPLREETFYLSFRRPGWYFIPFDLAALVGELWPREIRPGERAYLDGAGYGLSPAMEAAFKKGPAVSAAPAGGWVREKEPILRITAPSFLASWFESLVIWLQYPIQVATEALLAGRRDFACSCEDEAAIARFSLEACGLRGFAVETDGGYGERVGENARAMVEALGGDGERIFEVGMRGATCMAMHRAALTACQEAGISKTSNVFLARELGMAPVGTTGHEHQQRWEGDREAFRAIRDMRPQAPSFLFDTYDAERIGIPAAIEVIRENPGKPCSVRFDSGDQKAQLLRFLEAGVNPAFVFMDSMDAEKLRELEAFAGAMGVPEQRRLYGAGGYLVGRPAPGDLVRDRVSAVYKLCQSGGRPVMKFSVPEKSTVPGLPVIFRRQEGSGPVGIIGQDGEPAPRGYRALNGRKEQGLPPAGLEAWGVGLSRETAGLVEGLRGRRMNAGPRG